MSDLTWQTFRDTDFSGMEDVAASWGTYIQNAVELEDHVIGDNDILKTENSGDFAGDSADATRAYFRRNVDRFIDDLEYAGKIKNHLADAAEWFEGKRADLDDLIAGAGTELVPTGGIGEERFEPTAGPPTDTDESAEERSQRLQDRADALTEEFRSLMQDVRDYDDDLATTFRAIDDEAPDLAPKLSDPDYSDHTADYLLEQHQDFLDQIESGEATPEQVNEWWTGLSEGDQELFATEHPEIIGPLDGIPTMDRDTSNRILLDQEVDGIEDQIRELEAQAEEAQGDLGADPSWSTIMAEIDALQERHDGLTNLQDEIEGDYPIEDGPDQPYYLIDFDSSGDGQAVVSVGNPDTADNVNVYVPGTGADLNGIGGDLGRAETMAADAYELSPDSTTASIMWLGYDAPDTIADAGSESYAEGATGDLSSFSDGLRASSEGDPANLTMTGHSYGSTTIGVTARDEGLDADNMIFVGSPGVGVDSAEDLGIGADNVWASLNDEDIISWARPDAYIGGDYDNMVHGTDPTSYDFGGNEFSSEATRDGAKANHSAYWDEENDQGRMNMARIVTGNTEGVQ